MPRWIDLSVYGVAIGLRDDAQGKALVLRSLTDTPVDRDMASALGFAENGAQFVRTGSTISLAQVRGVYPEATVRNFEAAELAVPVAVPAPAPKRSRSLSAMAAIKAASLSPTQFGQQATFMRDGVRWRAALEGVELDLGQAAIGPGSRNGQPSTKTVMAMHAELVRQADLAQSGHGCLPALCAHPKLAYPSSLSKGRMAEMNVMRLLSQLDVASELMRGEDGYVKIHNGPYKDLVIERHPARDPGRRNAQGELFLTHYSRQGGDTFIDCEMVFGIGQGRLWFAETATQNPFTGGESRGHDRAFANMFSRNLLQQGFGTGVIEWPRRRVEEVDAPKFEVFEGSGGWLAVQVARMPEGWVPVWTLGTEVRLGGPSNETLTTCTDFQSEAAFTDPLDAMVAGGEQATRRYADLQALGKAGPIEVSVVKDLAKDVADQVAQLRNEQEEARSVKP